MHNMNEATAYIKRWQKTQKDLLKEGADCAYLYMHLEADTDEPFYIGMGDTSVRPWSKGSRTSKHKNRANKHGQRVHVDAAPVLTYDNALWWEVRWIKAFRDAGYDLVNLTDGGEGGKGYKHTPENIQKMSKIQQERVLSDDYVAPLHIPGVKEKHLEATRSEEFKEKQRARLETEGNPIDRPGAREAHWEATHSDEFIEVQRERMLSNNPMFTEEARANYYAAISTEEYKQNKIENASRGDDHYSRKDPSLGARNGARLQASFTAESRSEAGTKSWVTRRANIEAKGPGYVPEKSEKQIAAEKANGKRLQDSLTLEDRITQAKKGWEKRYRRYQYWGA